MRHQLNGLEIIEYQESVNDPVAIFLHGGPGLYGYMQSLSRSFSAVCNPVYFDQRGSKQGNGPIGIRDHLQDLECIVQYYSKVSKPVLVGHSWGAMLGVLFAGRFSSMIRKLILIGCGPLSEKQGNEFQKELACRFGDRKEELDSLWNNIVEEQDVVKQQRLADYYIDQIMEFYQGDPLSGPEIQPRVWDFKGGYHAMCESDRLIVENKYTDALGKIEVPVRLIQGSLDVVEPAALFSLASQHISDLKTYELLNAGHYPWVGPCRDEFMEILKREICS